MVVVITNQSWRSFILPHHHKRVENSENENQMTNSFKGFVGVELIARGKRDQRTEYRRRDAICLSA